MVVSGRADTPSFDLNSSNTNAITVSPTPSTAAVVYVAGTNDSSTPITFTESAPSYSSGDPVWLSESGSGFTTPTFLYFAIGGVVQQLRPACTPPRSR